MHNKTILQRLMKSSEVSETVNERRTNVLHRNAQNTGKLDAIIPVKASLSLNDINASNNRWATHARLPPMESPKFETPSTSSSSTSVSPTDALLATFKEPSRHRPRDQSLFPTILSPRPNPKKANSDEILDRMNARYSPLNRTPVEDIVEEKPARRINPMSIRLSSLHTESSPTPSSWGLMDIEDETEESLDTQNTRDQNSFTP